MATQAEKNHFVGALYELHAACNDKASSGALTQDQRSVFITAMIYLNSDIGKAVGTDVSSVPGAVIGVALSEIKQAIGAVQGAVDNATVQLAAKELWDANSAIDHVLKG